MIISKSVDETIASGERAAATAAAGDVIALVGDLGAGKTQWAKGFVSGMGGSTPVTSPTFTIVHEYEGGRLPVYHFDFYRIEDAKAADALGLDEYFSGDGVCLVEWADRFPELLPKRARWLMFVVSENGDRLICEREGAGA